MEHRTPWEKGSIRKGRKTGKHFIHNSNKNLQIPRSKAEIKMCKSLWGKLQYPFLINILSGKGTGSP